MISFNISMSLRFPELGARSYRAPLGGAIVLSCSLLHEVMPVTRGTCYAYLPFPYGDAGSAAARAESTLRHRLDRAAFVGEAEG